MLLLAIGFLLLVLVLPVFSQNLPYSGIVESNTVSTNGQFRFRIVDRAGVTVRPAVTHALPATLSAGQLRRIVRESVKNAEEEDVSLLPDGIAVGADNGNEALRNFVCSGTDKLSGFSANGFPICAPDQSGSGGAPTGAVVLIVSGTCAATLGAGWAEESSLSGKFVLGTVAANADIAGTGGSDSVTQVLNHTHPVSDPGHAHTTQRYPTTTGTSSGFTNDTSMSGTPTANTLPTASAATGVTTQNPAGGVTSIDNRPAFVKVIFCRKT